MEAREQRDKSALRKRSGGRSPRWKGKSSQTSGGNEVSAFGQEWSRVKEHYIAANLFFPPSKFPQNFTYFLGVNSMKMFFLLSVGLNSWVSPRSCWLGETPWPHTLISPSHGSPIPPPHHCAARNVDGSQLNYRNISASTYHRLSYF